MTNGKSRNSPVWGALNSRRPTATECAMCRIAEPLTRQDAQATIDEATTAGEAAFQIRDCPGLPGLVHLVLPGADE
jgi:hypothetical protein